MVIRKKGSKNFHEILIWSSVIGLEILKWIHAKSVANHRLIGIFIVTPPINHNAMPQL